MTLDSANEVACLQYLDNSIDDNNQMIANDSR
jgi:hypothetical protein